MISNSYNTKSASEMTVSMFGSTGTGGDYVITDVEVEGHLTTWNLKAANNLKNTSSDTASTAMQQPERLKTTNGALPPRAEAAEPRLQPIMKDDDDG